MQKINSSIRLREAILLLEVRQLQEGVILKEQFHQAYESIRPIHLIKSTFKEILESKELKDDLLNTSVGIASGYVSKALFEGSSHNPFKKLVGTALMFGVTNAVTKNPELIKAIGIRLFNFFGSKTRHEVAAANNIYNNKQ